MAIVFVCGDPVVNASILSDLQRQTAPTAGVMLGFNGVGIESVRVIAHQENIVTTSFEEDTLDLSNSMNFGRNGAVKIRYHHLDHEPFSYEIHVQNNTTKVNHGTVRIFLAPVCDELGNVIKIDELRRLMIELDRFHTTRK
ncbi:hemocyanin C chain [Trichonephila clavipes]|nr:hemocyanin C chain [Trichonephila clavipes]